jgi:hypothetical protein
VCAASTEAQFTFLENVTNLHMLLIEMAAVMDLMVCVILAITFLEGDGFLAPFVHQELEKVGHVFATVMAAPEARPNMTIIAETIAVREGLVNGTPAFAARCDDLTEYGVECVRPCWTYIESRLVLPNAKYEVAARVYRACQLFNPTRIRQLHQHAALWLTDLPFISLQELADMLRELPTYIINAENAHDINPRTLLNWWRPQEETPHFREAAVKCATLAMSSAAMERFFGMAQAALDDDQKSALADFEQATVMLRYNNREQTSYDSTRKKYNLGLDDPAGHFARRVVLAALPVHVVGLPVVVPAVVPPGALAAELPVQPAPEGPDNEAWALLSLAQQDAFKHQRNQALENGPTSKRKKDVKCVVCQCSFYAWKDFGLKGEGTLYAWIQCSFCNSYFCSFCCDHSYVSTHEKTFCASRLNA